MFHAEIINDADKLAKEEKKFISIPSVFNVDYQQVKDNYHQIKLDVKRLLEKEVNALTNNE